MLHKRLLFEKLSLTRNKTNLYLSEEIRVLSTEASKIQIKIQIKEYKHLIYFIVCCNTFPVLEGELFNFKNVLSFTLKLYLVLR